MKCATMLHRKRQATPSASSKYELLLINVGDAISFLRNSILFILLRQCNIGVRNAYLQSVFVLTDFERQTEKITGEAFMI